jgi:hemerythrin
MSYMMYMEKYFWKGKYSVGVKEIDEQHKHYFKLANDITEIAANKEVSADELLFKLTNLNGYASYHLATEENIFTRYKYPMTDEHIGAHNVFREKMKLYLHSIDIVWPKVNKLAVTIAEFAGDWLNQHILNMDQKYKHFVHEAGLT